MVDHNLLREFSVDEAEIDALFTESEELIYEHEAQTYDINQLLNGRVVRVDDEEVVVDIGYKSEGVIQRDEWEDDDELPEPGSDIEVLLEEFEDSIGLILLSWRKARRIRQWEDVISRHAEGDVVKGPVERKIKGGLLVDIGVHVFLPASQVDVRRPQDIGDYIGQDVECIILKIDEQRRNIVVSRRRLIEEAREKMKKELLETLQTGDLRKGTVKNIADFGAFVDLGGIDGLLHITDMSWGRISHPTEMVRIDDEIEVMVLNIDYEKEKIALGLKQKSASPWEQIDEKYPVNSIAKGEVVNVLTYGAFVKMEDGIEGLVHISEMSWTRRVSHPSELVSIGDEVDVMVLGINTQKQEISLGMKQTQDNPWDDVSQKYPVGETVEGTVRNLTNYGAFVELEEGVDGLLHISDMSWTRKVSHSNEILKKGDPIKCQILSVDEERRRIALGLKQLAEDPWETHIPEKYTAGSSVSGKVTKITNFGVFVELEDELEGLLHISELADHKVEHPETMVNVGEELDVRVLRVDTADRKIGLSCRSIEEIQAQAAAETDGTNEDAEVVGDVDLRTREELKGGMGATSGPLFSLGSDGTPVAEAAAEVVDSEENTLKQDATDQLSDPKLPSVEDSGEEAAGEEAAGEEAAGEEPAGEEPAGEEPAGEEPE